MIKKRNHTWKGEPDDTNPIVGFANLHFDGQTWRSEAACAEVSGEFFFPTTGDAGSARLAKKICARCPVATKTACLEYALENRDRYGVWGGLTPTERANLMQKRAAA